MPKVRTAQFGRAQFNLPYGGVGNALHSCSILSDDLVWRDEEEREDSTGQHENEESNVGS